MKTTMRVALYGALVSFCSALFAGPFIASSDVTAVQSFLALFGTKAAPKAVEGRLAMLSSRSLVSGIMHTLSQSSSRQIGKHVHDALGNYFAGRKVNRGGVQRFISVMRSTDASGGTRGFASNIVRIAHEINAVLAKHPEMQARRFSWKSLLKYGGGAAALLMALSYAGRRGIRHRAAESAQSEMLTEIDALLKPAAPTTLPVAPVLASAGADADGEDATAGERTGLAAVLAEMRSQAGAAPVGGTVIADADTALPGSLPAGPAVVPPRPGPALATDEGGVEEELVVGLPGDGVTVVPAGTASEGEPSAEGLRRERDIRRRITANVDAYKRGIEEARLAAAKAASESSAAREALIVREESAQRAAEMSNDDALRAQALADAIAASERREKAAEEQTRADALQAQTKAFAKHMLNPRDKGFAAIDTARGKRAAQAGRIRTLEGIEDRDYLAKVRNSFHNYAERLKYNVSSLRPAAPGDHPPVTPGYVEENEDDDGFAKRRRAAMEESAEAKGTDGEDGAEFIEPKDSQAYFPESAATPVAAAPVHETAATPASAGAPTPMSGLDRGVVGGARGGRAMAAPRRLVFARGGNKASAPTRKITDKKLKNSLTRLRELEEFFLAAKTDEEREKFSKEMKAQMGRMKKRIQKVNKTVARSL